MPAAVAAQMTFDHPRADPVPPTRVGPAEAVARDTARDVEFWKNINVEVDRRRRMHTPAYLEAQIMDALPQTAPAVITKWWQREYVVTPTAALGTGAALVLVAAAVTAVVMIFAH